LRVERSEFAERSKTGAQAFENRIRYGGSYFRDQLIAASLKRVILNRSSRALGESRTL